MTQNTISENSISFIKTQVSSQSARYYWWSTLAGFFIVLFSLVVFTQGPNELQKWAVALFFGFTSVVLGLWLWRWSMNRNDKKEIKKTFRLTEQNVAQVASEVPKIALYKTYTALNAGRAILQITGMTFMFYAISTLYGVATYKTTEYSMDTVVMQTIIGTFLIVASSILNILTNKKAKKMVSKLDTISSP